MGRNIGASLACLLIGISAARAEEQWFVSELTGASVPPEVFEETRAPAPDGLPDGLVATHVGDRDIASAWYAGPTGRYRHGVIGDEIEATTLVARTALGNRRSLTLPESEVFEDRYPRLADLDGDGKIEVIAIKSSAVLGASVTIYGLSEDALTERATTGFIGQANRWLNIAGIADFDGVPGREIAFVRTPHIGGTLYLYRYVKGALALLDTLDGFSNHEIGSRELRLSAVADINEDGRMELALPSNDRRALKIVGFGKEGLRILVSANLPARINKAIAVKGSGRNARIIVGLESGGVYEVHR